MLRAQHKSRTSDSAPVPMVCDVCRSQPAEAVVVEFISPAIDALRGLEPRPVISARIPETVFLLSELQPNYQFPDFGGLSPNSLESLLRLFPVKKHSLHHSQRPKL
jgi:hypothetical protein